MLYIINPVNRIHSFVVVHGVFTHVKVYSQIFINVTFSVLTLQLDDDS